MTEKRDDILQDPEEIRLQMQVTREALTEKLETLEHEVRDIVKGSTTAVAETVDTVKATVEGTVETVKRAVQDTVHGVKETLDLNRQVNQHPWAMMGASALAGYVVGSLVFGSAPRRVAPGVRLGAFADGPAQGSRPRENGYHRESTGPGLFGSLASTFGPELDKLKGLAIGTTLGLVRDIIRPSLPDNLAPQVMDVLNDITTKLGGEPVRGPVLDPSAQTYTPRQPSGHA